MLRRIFNSLLFTCLCIFFFQCGKEHTTIPTDVYVSGIVHDRAVYWKNGSLVVLPMGEDGERSAANSIYVYGTDIYVAGNVQTANNVFAVYWKNGELIRLASLVDETSSSASSISVSQSGVFVAGTWAARPAYWRNGQGTILDPDNPTGVLDAPFSIAVLGDDVFIAGFSGGGSDSAFYWRNGTRTYLESVIGAGQTKAIFANDKYVCVAGYYSVFDVLPGYWINGHYVPCNHALSVNSISVSESDVYVTGYYSDPIASRYSGAVWKNGEASLLSESLDFYSYTRALFILDEDVYVAGQTETPGAGNTVFNPVYWKNGVMTKLSDEGNTTGIFVKR